MGDVLSWVGANWDTLVAGAGALYALLSIVVKLTPTPRDDEWLRRAMAWASVLAPLGAGLFKRPGSHPE